MNTVCVEYKGMVVNLNVSDDVLKNVEDPNDILKAMVCQACRQAVDESGTNNKSFAYMHAQTHLKFIKQKITGFIDNGCFVNIHDLQYLLNEVNHILDDE